ncbi:hypothetical protein [Pseudomonas sp. GV085]|uniref:hypothetical protein n=1 Tax=Pseudomonas sp. GV085 TaxID=2135756 RepID=UPI000D3D5E4A|nr:hypothetical protein [Pseudomonas sp. GV085]PTR21965.1 hypothetical protein C8K63_11182 [Pseudomonas sp. GV085]
MTILEKLSAKEQRLLSYRKKPRSVPLEDLKPPSLETILLLPEKADDPGNQLHSRDQGLEMKLTLSRFPTSNYPDKSDITVQALFNDDPVGNELSGTTPLDDAWFEQTLTVPAGKTATEGEHRVQYRIKYRLNEDDSLPLIIRVDKTPPSPATQAIVPDRIKTEGITAEYFDEEGVDYVLVGYLATYPVAKIGDVVEFMVKEVGKPDDQATLIERIERLDLAVPLSTQKLTKSLIGIEQGEIELFVYVTDRKGNKSLASPKLKVDVSLFPAPAGESETVPLHDDDNIILFEDARDPVRAILNYTNFKDKDQWRLVVDQQTPALEPDVDAVPFSHAFTYRYLYNGNDGPKDVDFEWQVRRGNKLYPETPHSRKLKIDLRKPGEQPDPDNPGNPGSPDPKLPLITVQGVDRSRPNYLIKVDGEIGAIAFVKIYKGHKKDDVAQLIYHGVEVEDADGGIVRLDGSETDDTVLQFRIPGAYIAGSGNNKKTRVEYIVSHDQNTTVARSNTQHVEVYVNEIPMPQPDFAITGDAGDGPELYCGSLKHNADLGTMAVEVKFPAKADLANTKITFHVQGYENTNDGNGNAPGLVIPEAADSVEKEPTAAEASAGFSVFFAYHVFEKIKNGWCEVSCTAVQQGYVTPSGPRLFRVGMERPGGDFCAIP